MKNTCLLYIACEVLKLILIIIYKIQPPSSFTSYLLFYIFFSNGFNQRDRVVSCTKVNLHHHYPLHLQNWTAVKYILKEVWDYSPFVPDQPNPVSHKHKPNIDKIFKHLSGHQCKVSVALILLALPQEDSCNSALIYVLSQMIWFYMCTR